MIKFFEKLFKRNEEVVFEEKVIVPMNKQLYLMCGAPGSGKSTWLRKHVEGNPDAAIVSRDEIRFSYMNSKDDHYFSHETEVFNEFIETIQNYLDSPEGPMSVYADATHLTEKSRLKVLRRLRLDNVDVTVIVIRASLEETIKRNHKRPYHAVVPDNIVTRMWNSFERPENDTEIPVHALYVELPNEHKVY